MRFSIDASRCILSLRNRSMDNYAFQSKWFAKNVFVQQSIFIDVFLFRRAQSVLCRSAFSDHLLSKFLAHSVAALKWRQFSTKSQKCRKIVILFALIFVSGYNGVQ